MTEPVNEVETIRRGLCRVVRVPNVKSAPDEDGIALRPMPWVEEDEVRATGHHNDPQRIIDALAALERLSASRERYREALERVANDEEVIDALPTPTMAGYSHWMRLEDARSIARQALTEGLE